MYLQHRTFRISAAVILLALAMIQLSDAQSRAPQDQSWNRRVDGAGEYQTVLEVSGRIEVTRAMKMPDALDLKSICQAKQDAERRAFLSAEGYLSALEKSVEANRHLLEIVQLHNELGQLWSYRGDMAKAIKHFESARATLVKALPSNPQYSEDLIYLDEILGVAHLRKGELDNCVHNHNAETCIFPLSKQAQHKLTAGSSAAVKHFKSFLAKRPDNLEVRWLLDLAMMTLGENGSYGSNAAKKQTATKNARAPIAPITPRFPDVAAAVGADRISGAGGTILDDFDNDGFTDIVISSVDACESLKFFRNNGNGSFSDQTDKAGLSEQIGGINCIQTDFNNDGWLDVFVMRGGWEFAMRNSLLRNNGDGAFSDVTEASGLLSADHRTHSSAWADFDNDGWLDVFVAHEETPSQLFRNRGNGTFEDVTRKAGVGRTAFSKGATWGDYDNDGFADLYVSNYGSENFLYRNKGDGTFEEVAGQLGVGKPLMSFPTWFFDYDNDGWLDLFVASFVPSVTEVARGFQGLPSQAETMKLYRGKQNGGQHAGFEDITAAVGLAKVVPTMGANFGDFDNDGFLDFYLGTGAPSYAALMPNFAFRNREGKGFADVTAAMGTGHLQKGHGVGFGDLDNDGDQDLYVNVGGFIPGDKYNKALFTNPTVGQVKNLSHHQWISIKLVGEKSNRAAIGAKIKLTLTDATGKQSLRYKEVSSGGSFGASPLTQHFGLGKFQKIAELEVQWPVSKTRQVFRDVAANQFLEIKESASEYQKLVRKSFSLTKAVSPHANHQPKSKRP
ncbi:MAG: FG-GAP-like repeat-containing protein [Acidobacteriota bacterium]|nr:FG-GAP-like repeat-containing protein [Acidobacteriota bacterium]